MAGITRRVVCGVSAFALAFGPLALGAQAQETEPECGVDIFCLDDGEPIVVLGDPPTVDGLAFTPSPEGLLSDADVQVLIAGLTLQELQASVTGDSFVDVAPMDGFPDVGDPGALDLRPADDVLQLYLDVIDGGGTVDDATAAVTAAQAGAVPDGQTVPTYDEFVGDFEVIGDDAALNGQCGGVAISYGPDDEILDAAVGIGTAGNGLLVDTFGDGAGSRAFTSDNKFEVRADGKVVYFGYLPFAGGDGARDHRWEISSDVLSLDKGGDPNPNRKNANAGVVDFEDNIPSAFRFTGDLQVEGEFFSNTDGLWCVAEGWVHFGGPWLTPVTAAATALAAGGFLGLLFNSRPAQTFHSTARLVTKP